MIKTLEPRFLETGWILFRFLETGWILFRFLETKFSISENKNEIYCFRFLETHTSQLAHLALVK